MPTKNLKFAVAPFVLLLLSYTLPQIVNELKSVADDINVDGTEDK